MDEFERGGWIRRIMDLEQTVNRLNPDGERRRQEERQRDQEARQRDLETIEDAREAYTRQKVKAEGLEKELDALRRRVVKLEGDAAEAAKTQSKGETKMADTKIVLNEETGLAKVRTTTRGDLKAVAPRLGARQAARLARDVVITKGVAERLPVDPETRKAIVRFLKTKQGEAAVGGILGLLLTYVELPGVPRGERMELLAEALRREALTEFGDELVEPLAAIVREVMTGALGGMADDTATVEVAPKKE